MPTFQDEKGKIYAIPKKDLKRFEAESLPEDEVTSYEVGKMPPPYGQKLPKAEPVSESAGLAASTPTTGLFQLPMRRDHLNKIYSILALKSEDCGPGFAGATKWGEWNTDEAAAETSAFTKALNAAERGCHGGCDEGEECKYTEASTELLDTETRENEAGQTEYRCKVRSTGSCGCE